MMPPPTSNPAPRRFKYELWLYALALFTAFFIRFLHLDALPLNDTEAQSALQALRVSQGLNPALGPHPLYILSTSVLFFAYGGGTDFLARFFPALIGSLLVLAPLLFAGERLKPRTAVLLAFMLALDPGLVAISRQAASPIFAITFALLALGFFQQRKSSLAGAFAALALLSGPSIWLGILGMGITWAIYQALRKREESAPQKFDLPLAPFLAVFLLAGSLFFIVPNGLSAAFASIPAFFARWANLSELPNSQMAFSLLVYQPAAILLGLAAIIRGFWKASQRIIPLAVWFFVALLLAVFIPSREMPDLAWALIPLWALAAIELTRNLDIFPEERRETFGVFLLTIFIWVFSWLNLAGFAWAAPDTDQYTLRIGLLIGSLALLFLSLMLVAAGWSVRVAQLGGLWGLTLTLGLLGAAGAFGSAGLRGLSSPELWHPASLPLQADLLQATVRDMSEWGVGNDYAAPVVIAGINSPALEWLLREHPVTVTNALDVSSAPNFVITAYNQEDPALSSAYRGQEFLWRQTPLWNTTSPKDWLRWLVMRDLMPRSGESIILWAREDMFVNK